ncbi:hypothetical protein V6N13_023171 [Hibiscus sabdariffa]
MAPPSIPKVAGILTPSFLLTTFIWMTDTPEVSSVLVMQSTGGGELLSSPPYVAEASIAQVSDPVEENVEVHSSFYGACYVEATRFIADAVLALGRLQSRIVSISSLYSSVE